MGKPVVLDSDDVEALLLAGEYGAKIEDMYRAVIDDPQAVRLKPKMRDAVDRARRAWGNAIRETSPEEREDPSETEANILRVLYEDHQRLSTNEIGEYIDYLLEKQALFPACTMVSLRAKRLIVAGGVSTIVKWGDKTTGATPFPQMIYRLTPRGADWGRADWQKRNG